MAKRGLLGEIIHQQQVAQQRQARAYRANEAANARYQREQARIQRERERTIAAQNKADTRNAIEAEKARKLAHIADQEAYVAESNLALERELLEIGQVLQTGIEAGGYIELETLRTVVEHPEFASPHLTPTTPPDPIQPPEEPVLILPDPPKGLGGLFKKSEHAAAVLAAQGEHEQKHSAWRAEVAAIPLRQMEQMTAYAQAEEGRERNLNLARLSYDLECVERQKQADADNAHLDEFIAGLKSGQSDLLEEYVEMVFGRSEYPEYLGIEVKCAFDGQTKELRVDLELPSPSQLPQVKQYRYTKATDVISEVAHTAKELRDQYSTLINATTLRSLHEIFDADRDGHIQSISLIGGVNHTHEGTGKEVFTPLIHLACSRETFKEIDLRKVNPPETLKYLGAVISKNSYALEPVVVKTGVRSI